MKGVLRASLVVAVLAMAGVGSVQADEVDDLRAEVERLKQQMLFLQNQIPQGGAQTGVAAGGTVAAQNEVRFQQFDQRIAQVVGQIERVELQLNDLAQKIERMQKDTEFRLSELESRAAGMPMGADAMATGEAGAATAGAAPTSGMGTEATAAPPAPTQPGVLGTLSAEQMQNLPQAPAGAAEQAASAAAATVVLPGNTPQEQYNYATGLLQRGAYAEAEIALKSFVEQYPGDPLAGNAQYWLGETYYVRSDFKNAAVAFAAGFQKYPQSSKAPDNLLKLGMSLGQTGRKQDACTAFAQLDKRFPDASQAIKDRAQRAKQRYECK
ncbi:tol-pal system protein YbgF [Dongia mobilis]|uniref:Cell division coordinator CpoB n=2 Tax=Dongia mobilis TaxID=578943 RepID=A0A4R6WD97_9PROT|nr:tol-pal system protein YbgF [Dongia mobilis]